MSLENICEDVVNKILDYDVINKILDYDVINKILDYDVINKILDYDVINKILDYDGRIKYRKGYYVDIIHKNDIRYNIIQNIIVKKKKY